MVGAILLFILNLAGLGGGPIFGRVSDMAKVTYGDHSLLIGYAALAPMIVLAVLAHLAAAGSIARDKQLAAAI